MKATDLPTKVTLAFGGGPNAGSYQRTVPVASQIGITDGAASFTDGFPPLCFLPIGSGGKPPAGVDIQYMFNLMTAWNKWQAAGGLVPYDPAFSTAIGGYPMGATVMSATTTGRIWVSSADNNTTNPDGANSANWLGLARQSDIVPTVVGSGQVPTIVSAPTIWVRTDGSDTNDGSANTPAKAFATIAAAMASSSRIAPASGAISIRLGVAGSYAFQGASGYPGSAYIIQGDANNPSQYIITGYGISAISTNITTSGLTVVNNASLYTTLSASTAGIIGAQYTIFQSTATNSNFHIGGFSGGTAIIGPGCVFASSMGGIGVAQSGALQISNNPVTVQNTPTWSNAAVVAQACGTIGIGAQTSFIGTANGPRYNANSNGVIVTNGAGANFFPGSTAGSTVTGGVYI